VEGLLRVLKGIKILCFCDILLKKLLLYRGVARYGKIKFV